MAGTRPVIVSRGRSRIIGGLYLKTDTHVVLLNNITASAYLGPVRARRDRHIEPEADVMVLPIDADTTIDYLE